MRMPRRQVTTIELKRNAERSGSQWEHIVGRLWETYRMKKARLRVIKWLGEIPVEIECTACPEWRFQAMSSSHRPNREEYSQQLQRAFDQHFKTVHAADESAKING